MSEIETETKLMATVSAVITRADGSVEDLGVISRTHWVDAIEEGKLDALVDPNEENK